MYRTLKTIAAAGIIAVLSAGSPALFAANQNDNAKDPGPVSQMMQGNGQMVGGMGKMSNDDMMSMMNMMTEMNQMMGNCNKMMQNTMDEHHRNDSNPHKG